MTDPAPKVRTTFAEYLALELKAETKHEYVNGEVFAMAGGTIEHGRLANSVTIQLGIALQGKPCATLSSDVRVRVVETGRATYPDVSVVCGKIERDREDKDSVVNPVVIVEVLSDTTEASDRGDKFAHYRRIPSLRHYVLVSQHEPRIESYARAEDGEWRFREAGPGGAVRLEAIDCQLSVDAVYADPLASAAS
jgi:Uma2 family endonuclease